MASMAACTLEKLTNPATFVSVSKADTQRESTTPQSFTLAKLCVGARIAVYAISRTLATRKRKVAHGPRLGERQTLSSASRRGLSH